MKKYLYLTLCLPIILVAPVMAQSEDDATMLRKIYDETLLRGEAYENLRSLCKDVGGRVSGSPEAAAAVEWGRQLMQAYGFDSVFLQSVMVPHWVRGQQEIGRIVNSQKLGTREVNITALGNAVGTGDAGVLAKVVEVHTFDELADLGEENVKGKIVFFNRPMDQTQIQTGSAYGLAGNQRRSGPSEAAKYGAVGVIVRSLSTAFDDYPHTGSTVYSFNIPKIPAVAISTNDADLLSKTLEEEPTLSFYLETHCEMLDDVLSYNVVGEITGNEYPNEYIVVGGHLDSWDLAEGAHDDGAGVVHSIEVLRTMKAMDYRPKRTIRVVLFMNEENGLAGAKKYAELAEEHGENHLAAIESDAGGFAPRGFGLDVSDAAYDQIQRWKPLFEPYDLHKFDKGGSGADISALKPQGVELIGLRPDSQRYFDMHHSALDVFEIVNRRELLLGSAAMTSLVYLIDQYGFIKDQPSASGTGE
ncbi:M20/M25/M40 family metallo-hydrolase [Tunicatimonas pelagia]|uniref:M20/M25/M40 family metallo-hydrolase n=1 Tax=Tunicatimonas pelagia TaxID=931531 RepID=UPI00266664C9|nr:M20/M25/M40 family metallo-hydrolase [Tunicatimonas pelagia]WKN41890.1 M20/M25/M40 family metallo-hydrolase [Tunicatimonas pelagia]